MNNHKHPNKKPYFLRILGHLFRLPNHIAFLENATLSLSEQLGELSTSMSRHQNDIEHTLQQLEKINVISKQIDAFSVQIGDIQHKLSLQQQLNVHATTSPTSPTNNTMSDDPMHDFFYKKFEDRFRGSEELIRERATAHLHLFESLPAKLKKMTIVDIGCGRGEFLSVLKQYGYKGVGVDMNEEMVRRANENGYKALVNDALSYLQSKKNNSLAAVTGFHIVEHIPAETLLHIFNECYRTVTKGGFVLFETPNPASLVVGANTFYLDPSHIRPLPSDLLKFMLEYSGFEVEIVPLHRISAKSDSLEPEIRQLHETVFGYADYAAIGRKP